jgi:nucleotide-binding universal stress UspA family protein
MLKLERVLVPVDFSDCSAVALDLAQGLANKVGASIDVLHVWRVPTFVPAGIMIAPGGGEQQSFAQAVQDGARKELDGFVRAQRDAGCPIGEVRLEEGDPWQVISSVAEQHAYDLIVIGTHGRSGLMHVLLGSVAERVVRQSRVPVMTVRRPSTRQ